MTDPFDLSPLERARRYRERAAEARRDADRTSGEIREGYLMVERGWLSLVSDIEAAQPVGDKHPSNHGRQQAAPRAPTDRKI